MVSLQLAWVTAGWGTQTRGNELICAAEDLLAGDRAASRGPDPMLADVAGADTSGSFAPCDTAHLWLRRARRVSRRMRSEWGVGRTLRHRADPVASPRGGAQAASRVSGGRVSDLVDYLSVFTSQ